jgi:uncharacterized membrane protein YqiK
VFFWGNFIFNLVIAVFMAVLALLTIKECIHSFKKRSQQKSNKIKNSINKKFRNKRDQEPIKSTKALIFDCIGVIAIIGISFMFLKETYFLAFDIPNVINQNYIKATVEIERSVKASSKGDTHSQYITARNIENNDIIDITFSHKYERILVYKYYDIWYLPHSHLGYKAQINSQFGK